MIDNEVNNYVTRNSDALAVFNFSPKRTFTEEILNSPDKVNEKKLIQLKES